MENQIKRNLSIIFAIATECLNAIPPETERLSDVHSKQLKNIL